MKFYIFHSRNDRSNIVPTMGFESTLGGCLTYCVIRHLFDNHVLFFSHKNKLEIERCLNVDMDNLCEHFRQNELVIDLKLGKTETMLFGTCKRLKNAGENLEIVNGKISGKRINFLINSLLRFTRTKQQTPFKSNKVRAVIIRKEAILFW